MDTVWRLNEAGVPCGVLIAPILPGLSDRPEQLEEVVTACVGAGATSISSVALHLRPGVREHYLSWLAGARPDLVDLYRRSYRTAYLGAAEQKALATRVRALVEATRGSAAPPDSSSRGLTPATALPRSDIRPLAPGGPKEQDRTTQLQLGF